MGAIDHKRKYLSKRIRFMGFLILLFGGIILFVFTMTAIRFKEYASICILLYVIYGAVLYVNYKWIYQPYKENAKILYSFIKGYSFTSIYEQRIYLSPEFEDTIFKFKELIDTNELISASKKQAQYLALQNQINPHFLYNTLEGIRGETLNAGLESVAEMTEALATYFRYTISNVEHLVTLEDELKNIQNYYIIQQYRFGERLSLLIEYNQDEESEIMRYRLPKLTLQPIVENSIYHGIERKIGKGHLRIKIERTARRLIITISDDGIGMEKDRLTEINEKLNNTSFDYAKADSEVQGGIAIINVNSRIRLLFGEEYGITIYSTADVGTDVEITLPLIEKA